MAADDEEEELFRREMADVRPVRAEPRVALGRVETDSEALERRRRAAVEAARARDENFLSGEHVPQVDPHDHLDYRRPGVQHGVHRKLRMGQYPLEARLDLHRMSVEQARLAVYRFIRDCRDQDIRCSLITHGKGAGRERPALLKSCVAHWLPQFDEVLAFHSAQRHHGGSGATYLLLKKSDRKRQDNRELHQKR